jgi:hypothetical protein
MKTMEDLHFTYNWNNKLDCKAFTTIRIYNEGKHVPGVKLRIMLKRTENKGIGMIADVRPFLLQNMNPFISFLDTGYPVEQCKNIFLKMYPKIDFTKKKLALILIVKE